MSMLAPLALAALLAPATAVQSSPWSPWYGCWRAEDAPAGEFVCVVPAGAGARIVTLDRGAVRGDSRVYADGIARATSREGCATLEWSRWSNDRERLFLTSQLTCDGRLTRRSQGIFAFTSAREWVSVQTITGEEGAALRTVRFTPAEGVRLPASIAAGVPARVVRSAWAERVDEGDVLEATEVLDPETVQEWLRSAGVPYQLADTYASAGGGSALDDLARVSHPVEYRTVNVVHILEPSWCIYGACSWLRSARCWGPWGYDRFAWHGARPVIYYGSPVLVRLGVDIGIGRSLRIARYHGWGRDRYGWRDSGYGTGWLRDEPARVGRPRLGTGTGTGTVRTAQPRGSASAPAIARGSDPRFGSTRQPEIVRAGDPRSTGSRQPEIVRGSGSRGTGIGRSEPSRPAPPRGTAIGRGETTRTSAPRGTATGRGDPPGTSSGAGRGVARPRGN